MIIGSQVPRQYRSVADMKASVFEHLVKVFVASSPGSTPGDFFVGFYLPIRRSRLGGDEAIVKCMEMNGGKFNLAGLLLITCAFYVQARSSVADERVVMSYLMDASLYLGMAVAAASASPHVERLQNEVARYTLSRNGRDSAQINVAGWQQAREEAIRLAAAYVRAGASWATPTEAARVIGDEVASYIATLKPIKRFQSLGSREVTIADWLRNAAEAAQWFGNNADHLGEKS